MDKHVTRKWEKKQWSYPKKTSDCSMSCTDKTYRQRRRYTCYAQRANSAAPYPDFHDVYRMVAAMYEADRKKDDSLIKVLRDPSDFDLFWRHDSDVAPIDRLSNRTLLIDVHAMPVLKELLAYLVIERLYKEMALLPDSPIRYGRCTIRSILVIDEARNYLSQRNIFMERIICEGRSKGIVVFFACQSPQ